MLEKIRKEEMLSIPDGRENMQGLREKFFLRLCNNLFETKEQFLAQKEELGIDFSSAAMLVVAGEVEAPLNNYGDNEKLQSLYSSSIQMVREILEKTFTCYTAVIDTRHFILTVCLIDKGWRKQLEESLQKTISIAHDYFNTHLRMAAGIPVEDPLMLETSYRSALRTLHKTSRDCPFLLSETPDHKQQRIAKVEEYIRHNLDKQLSLREVATIFNFSPNYLSQLFSKYAGEGFIEYINTERIHAAKEMLARGEDPIYQIAEKLGFENAFYFSKVFKRVEGISPRDFLHKFRGNQ
jgi:two-component system response regulator YesN